MKAPIIEILSHYHIYDGSESKIATKNVGDPFTTQHPTISVNLILA